MSSTMVRQRPIRAATEPRPPRCGLYARGQAAIFNLTDDVRGEADRERAFGIVPSALAKVAAAYAQHHLEGQAAPMVIAGER